MSDKATRAAQRTGGGLIQRWRADEIPTFTVARDVACPEGTDCAEWGECPGGCKGTGRVPFNPQDVMRLLAFLGVEEAREVVGPEDDADWNKVSNWPYPAIDLTTWLDGLSSLLSHLPPHRLLVNSTRPLVYALDRRVDSGLVETKTNWPHDTPAEHWLLADAALACAGECSRIEDEKARSAGVDPAWIPEMHRTRRAIAAGRAWVEEPTETALLEWSCAAEHPRPDLPGWVPRAYSFSASLALQAAAIVIGAARVREIVTAALSGRLL